LQSAQIAMAERQIMREVRCTFLEICRTDAICPGCRLCVTLATDNGEKRIDLSV